MSKPSYETGDSASYKTHLRYALAPAGVDMAVIALWLGHESIETTHVYVEADLATKKRALERIAPTKSALRRFKPDDTLLAFLASL